VHDDQEGRTRHQDELQGPEADVGDREEVVKADVGTAWLPRVAIKVLVIIAPNPLGRHEIDQQAEDEDEGEPDAAEGCGVLVDTTEEPLEHPPFLLWVEGVGPLHPPTGESPVQGTQRCINGSTLSSRNKPH
uniref:Uncharacterized protein n=1 Tax=Cyanistes caeruleus TaxID=156563 RepID=A0A8C0VA28_CYACU